MKNIPLRGLFLVGILIGGSRIITAQEPFPQPGPGQILVDKTGTFRDANTGAVLTPEEVAARLAGENQEGETVPEPGSQAESGGTDMGSGAPPNRSGLAEELPFAEEGWGGNLGAVNGGMESWTGSPGQAKSRSGPSTSSSPSPENRPRNEAEELLFQLLETTLEEESEESLSPPPEEGPPSSEPVRSTPASAPSSPRARSLLPPNSPAGRLLRDPQYALREARLIAAPDGRLWTLQEARNRHYREAEVRALWRQYERARTAWEQGDEAALRRNLPAFLEGLKRFNATAGRSREAEREGWERDLEALRERLNAEQEGISPGLSEEGAAFREPGWRRWAWFLYALGLLALLVPLGVAVVRRQIRGIQVPPRQQVKGRVLVLRGPDAGRVWSVAGERVLLGTGEDCHVTLTDSSLAPVHAALTREPEGIQVACLNPDSEVLLNGRPIETALLREGDVVEMGRTTLSFEREPG